MILEKLKNTKAFNFFFKNESKNKGKIKAFFSQLSRGLMLPIAILPIAGLLLGIGGAIGANVSSEVGIVIANIFKGMSDVIFANLPLLFCVAIIITFAKDKGTAAFAGVLGFLVFSSSQLAFMQFDESGKVISILWFHKELQGIITSTLGMPTLQTSIFGGIIVGGLSAVIYNKFSQVKLPTALDFFSGVRLVPFILIPAMFALSLAFLLFWPWIGQAITFMGRGIQEAPFGSGGFIYGVLGRALMPFGLHHIPIVLAFQTEFGGVLEGTILNSALINNNILAASNDYNIVLNAWQSFTKTNGIFEGNIIGDQNIWNFINSISLNRLPTGVTTSAPLFQWFNNEAGVYAGRFTQDYPTYLGACMGIGAALIFAAEKKNKRNVSIIIGSSMVVAFLTGITEPLEFSFLFSAPLLYYLVYVPISGASYALMEIAGAHVGVGFARGFIDLIIYGAIPFAKGTNFYWAFVIAIAEAIIMFGIFYFAILKFDIATPGRKDNPMSLISKKEYNERKQSKGNETRILKIINYLGGKENLTDVSACATRLRVSVHNINLINQNDFVSTGSKGIILKEKSLQIIYGGEASIIADKINDLLQDPNANFDFKETAFKSEIKQMVSNEKFIVYAPVDGEIIPMDQVPDETFSQNLIGQGIAIKPIKNNFNAVLNNGTLAMAFDTGHAYIFQTPEGSQVMVHIGVDSVNIKEKVFTKKFDKLKQKIDLKSKIVDVNLELLSNKAKSDFVPIIVMNETLNGRQVKLITNNKTVKQGEPILEIF